MAAIKSVRAANPRAALPDVIKQAGVMASINAGLDPMKTGKAAVETKTSTPAKTKVAPPPPRGQSPIPPKKKKPEQEENTFAELHELMQEAQR